MIAALLMWLGATFPIAAQSVTAPERWSELADTIFRNYGPDDGLPVASVTSFAQDGDGFLWVGTEAGLARWDGYHFHVYRSDPGNLTALQDDFVWCLKTDSQGRLWVGTNGGGVSRYDRMTDRFVTYATASRGGGNAPVRSLAGDGQGGMWVGSDRGLDHLAADGRELVHLRHDSADPTSLPGDQVLSLLRDHDGHLWVGTNRGLADGGKTASSFTSIPIDAGVPNGPPIRALIEAADGRLWVGTENHGAYVRLPTGSFENVIREGEPTDLKTMTVRAIAEASPGLMWLGTDGQGVVSVDASTGRIERIRHDPGRSTSLPHDFVFSLYRGHSGLLWVGTYSGLGLHDPTQHAVLNVFGESHQTLGLTGADVMSTLSARDGSIWVGFLEGDADILDPAGHRIASLRSATARPRTSLASDRVRALAQTDDGDIYLGTSRGLYRARPGGGGLVRLRVTRGTSDPVVLSLMNSASGLWIGTRGDGLWRIDRPNGTARRHAAEALTNQWISAIAEADAGRLWIGTYQGLYLFDPDSERVRRILLDPKGGPRPSGELVSSLLQDQKGRLWVGMLGAGIALLDKANGDGRPEVRRLGVAEGLPDLNIVTLLEDDSGVVWASTGTGLIVRIDPDTLAVKTLRRADGVGIRSFAMNGGAKTPQGELLFGGDGGITVIRPGRLKSWDWRPPIVVTDLRVGGREVPPQRVERGGGWRSLDITPDANSLTVEFSALDYSAPDQNRYAYRLEGYDDRWVMTDSTRRLASYTNLSPGRYVLHLRGSNRDGIWSEATLDIPVRILPAWYQTLLFRVALALLGGLAVWMLVRARTSYLRHRQSILERQVAERTAELRQTNSELEARTTELGQSLREVAEGRAKVANLLDTSGQGFLSFGSDLIVEAGCSRACASMLGQSPEGRPADLVLFGEGGGQAELFREVVASALASPNTYKRDLLFSLLPATLDRGGCLLKAEYRCLDNGHVMVVLTDVTEENRLSRKVESERQRLAMIVMAVSESRDFIDAVDAFRRFYRQDLAEILAARASPMSIHQEIYRQVHTHKGTLAQFHFGATPRMLHALEEKLSQLKREAGEMTVGRIVEQVLSVDYHGTLETDLAAVGEALGREFLEQGKGVFLPLAQARKLRVVAERLSSGAAIDLDEPELREILAEFRNLDKIALAEALAGYERVIREMARKLNKEVERLSVDGGEDIWIDPGICGPFLRSLVHVFRNAVVHGIEDPEQRLANGKEAAGRIECTVRRRGAGLTLAIADDGAGIGSDMLRARAVSLGLMSEQQAAALGDEEALALIFLDDVSVRQQADELAGRGVGLAAVRAEVHALGGEVVVTSAAGRGTRLTFDFPHLEGFSYDGVSQSGQSAAIPADE